MKYKDRTKTRSEVISYVKGESWRDRHERRLAFNLKAQEWVREEAERLGLTLKVTNNGHHWQFRAEGFAADWWPSSAKLVINQHWHDGVHVHDHLNAVAQIDKYFQNHSKRK